MSVGGAGGSLMSSPAREEIVYDWNQIQSAQKPAQPFDFDDESLRDGVQSPSVTDPPLAAKIELLELMESIGVRSVDIGLPGAGKRAFEDVVALAQHIQKRKREMEPNCAARTVLADIKPVVEEVQKSGQKIVLYTFIGSSPIRQYAETWDLDFILKASTEAIDFGIKEGLQVAYVTEDTTRASPPNLERLFRNAIDHGASRLVLRDPDAHGTPRGAASLVGWPAAFIVKSAGGVSVAC